jgi:hypothetical protein
MVISIERRKFMKQLIVLLAIMLVLPAAFADKSDVQLIDMRVSGSLIHVDAGGLFEVNLKGSPGAANGRGLAVTGPPVLHSELPAGNACADFGPGPSGVYITEAQMNMTFNDGSMIWGDAASDGYVCFSGFAYAPYVIMGGYGRFEGATGWVAFELDTHRFPVSYLVTPETGFATGEIILP